MKIPVSVIQSALARISANAIPSKSAMTVVRAKTARQTVLVNLTICKLLSYIAIYFK